MQLKLLTISGMVIGLLVGSDPIAKAQDAAPQVEEVRPTITAGSIGSNTVIAHRVAADQLLVAGYDVGKLLEGLLNAMGNSPTGTLSHYELQQIVNNARQDKPLKLVLPEAPHPQQPNNDKNVEVKK
jgi:hypothetical protein